MSGLISADSSPFATANRTVFVRSLGLPLVEDARAIAAGQSTSTYTLEHTSQFAVDDQGIEQAFLDGETTTLSFSYRHALSQQWSLGIELPVISHQSGFMDSFIEGWHRTFGLPNARRDEFPRDRLLFQVSTPSTNARLNSSTSGLGDIALLARREFFRNSDSQIHAQLRLEMPSGDADELLGSDSWDVALGINAYSSRWFSAIGADFHGNIGLILPGDSDLLGELQEDTVAYGSASLAWPFYWDWLTLKAQLEAHTAFYETSIKSLGKTSAQLTFGAGLRLSERWNLNIGLSEDIAVRTAPDFTVVVSLQRR